VANLTPSEKELLAVIRYYNSQRKQIARLVKKLNENFYLPVVKDMTGFNGDEIYRYIQMVPVANRINNLGPSKATKKALSKFESEPVDLFDEKPKPRKRTPRKKSEPRFNTTVLEGRVAQEIFTMIRDGELSSGDKFWSRKELMQQFEIGNSTAGQVLKLLSADGLIEFIDPERIRLGYKVK
jgi:ribosomal protein S25